MLKSLKPSNQNKHRMQYSLVAIYLVSWVIFYVQNISIELIKVPVYIVTVCDLVLLVSQIQLVKEKTNVERRVTYFIYVLVLLTPSRRFKNGVEIIAATSVYVLVTFISPVSFHSISCLFITCNPYYLALIIILATALRLEKIEWDKEQIAAVKSSSIVVANDNFSHYSPSDIYFECID